MLPTTIAPMLAQFTPKAFNSTQHLFEIKWDGTRALAFIHHNGQLRIQNRRLSKIESRYPELVRSMAALPEQSVLDGEIVVFSDGKPDFNKLQQRDAISEPLRIEILSNRLPAVFVAFDLLYLEGHPLLTQPLWRRREKLAALCSDHGSPHFILSEHVLYEGIRYFKQIEHHGMEGIMAKQLDSPYMPGKRTDYWQKIKVAQDGVFDIIGYEPRAGVAAVSSLLLGIPHEQGWRYCGKVGSGFNEEQRRAMYEHLTQIPPLDPHPSGGPPKACWIVPRLKARIRYLEVTQSGKLRSPSFKGFV